MDQNITGPALAKHDLTEQGYIEAAQSVDCFIKAMQDQRNFLAQQIGCKPNE